MLDHNVSGTKIAVKKKLVIKDLVFQHVAELDVVQMPIACLNFTKAFVGAFLDTLGILILAVKRVLLLQRKVYEMHETLFFFIQPPSHLHLSCLDAHQTMIVQITLHVNLENVSILAQNQMCVLQMQIVELRNMSQYVHVLMDMQVHHNYLAQDVSQQIPYTKPD